MEIVAPDMISIELDKKIEKKFPISAESIKVQIPEHYVQVGKIRFEPDSVTVSGPESKIIKMQSIPTELKEYKNKKKQFSDNIYVNKIDENVFIYDVSKVKLFVDIQIIGEKVLEDVNIKVINVPVGYSVKVEPATVNLKIKGGINYVNEIKKEDISVEISWNKEWEKYRAYTEKLIIRHPNDVISYEEMPKTFTVIVG
jgi:YbbR domain-containing protein